MRLEAVGKRYGLREPWVVRDVTRHLAAAAFGLAAASWAISCWLAGRWGDAG
jgi:hypothetical protein